MSNNTKSKLAISIVIGGILFFLATQSSERLFAEQELLKDELATFIVPDVTLNGVTYTVENGRVQNKNNPNRKIPLQSKNKVLRLAHYAVLQRLDPIFGLEETSPHTLRDAVVSLDKSTDAFAHYYYPMAEKTIRKYLYPVAFLTSLSELEASRQQVILSPSDKVIYAHQKRLVETMYEYKVFVNKLDDLYTDFNNTFGAERVSTIGGVVSNPHILAFLNQLNGLLTNNMREHEMRVACLTRFTHVCAPLKIPSQRGLEVTHNVSEEVPQHVLTNTFIFSNVLNKKEGFIRPEDTPIVILHDSKCHKDTPAVYYYLWWKEKEDGTRAFNAEYLNDLYFYDIVASNKREFVSPYFKAIEKTGITYLPQRIANLYMCPNQGKDIAVIRSLYAIYALLHDKPLTRNLERNRLSDEFKIIQEIEHSIVTSPVLYQADVAAFIDNLTALISERGETFVADSIGSEQVLYMEKLIQLYLQNSAHFDEILATIVDTNDGLSDIINAGSSVSLDGLFTSRAYIMATLLTFNNSVVNTPISFLEFKPNMIEAVHLVPYNTVLRKILTVDEVITLMTERSERLKNLEVR